MIDEIPSVSERKIRQPSWQKLLPSWLFTHR